ncbi:MAG TPA: hypothetical protein VN651_15400 [Gemmatimonadaceae bacterium]|nr:hypothetical protein [Gemmatimonadaceae bacterium]
MMADDPDRPEPVGADVDMDAVEANPPRVPAKASPVAVVFVGLVAFGAGLCILGFASLVAVLASNSGLVAFGLCLAIVVALFVVRGRSGASPYLSAVAVGAAAALVVVGGCIALFTGGGRIGG